MTKRFDRKGYQRDMGKCTGTRKYSNGRVGKCDHPSHGCFPAETLVHTPKGLRRISDICPGDLVFAYSDRTGRITVRSVLRNKSFGLRPVLDLHFQEDATTLQVTGSHTLLIEGKGWVIARQIEVGDKLVNVQEPGKRVQVAEIAALNVSPVHNLIVDGDFTFIVAEGFAAHSFTYARRTRVALSTLIRLVSFLGLSRGRFNFPIPKFS